MVLCLGDKGLLDLCFVWGDMCRGNVVGIRVFFGWVGVEGEVYGPLGKES